MMSKIVLLDYFNSILSKKRSKLGQRILFGLAVALAKQTF